MTRQRIHRVAVELFAEKGYHGTGVAEIGRAAGVRQGALYYHIGSKEELLFQVLKVHVEESLRGESAVVAGDLPPERKLEELIAHHVRTIAEHRDEVVIYLRDAGNLSGDRARELQRLRDEVEELWRQVLAEGVHAGVFRPVDQIEVNGLLGLVNTVYLWYRAAGRFAPGEIAGRFFALAFEGIGSRT